MVNASYNEGATALLATIPTIPHILPAPVGIPAPQSREILARRRSESGDHSIIRQINVNRELMTVKF
jgi:hypothetical protein